MPPLLHNEDHDICIMQKITHYTVLKSPPFISAIILFTINLFSSFCDVHTTENVQSTELA